MSEFTNITINPLLYDVLCGEFMPPSDSMRRRHTLGRLAFAGITKGRRLPGYSLRTPSVEQVKVAPQLEPVNYVYRPSWAQAVRTVVLGELDQSKRANILGLQLYHGPIGECEPLGVHFASTPGDEADRLRLIRPDGSVMGSGVELGPGLNDLRNEISATAQRFFDGVTE